MCDASRLVILSYSIAYLLSFLAAAFAGQASILGLLSWPQELADGGWVYQRQPDNLTRPASQTDRGVRNLRHSTCCVSNESKPSPIREYAAPSEAACDKILARAQPCGWRLLRASPVFPVFLVLQRAKAITQLCTHGRALHTLSIALFSPRQTSHMPSFQPSSELLPQSDTFLALSLPVDPWIRVGPVLFCHPPAPWSSLKTSCL